VKVGEEGCRGLAAAQFAQRLCRRDPVAFLLAVQQCACKGSAVACIGLDVLSIRTVA
jgi:hypothetical protein